jgi:hypothetical protein
LIGEQEAAKGLHWLETFYDEDTPTGANARCVGGLLLGMELICELEHAETVDGGLTYLEFRRVMGWLKVYSAARGEIGELARNAAKNLSDLAVSADPWGESH